MSKQYYESFCCIHMRVYIDILSVHQLRIHMKLCTSLMVSHHFDVYHLSIVKLLQYFCVHMHAFDDIYLLQCLPFLACKEDCTVSVISALESSKKATFLQRAQPQSEWTQKMNLILDCSAGLRRFTCTQVRAKTFFTSSNI